MFDMQEEELGLPCIIAEGPEGLAKVLDDLLAEKQFSAENQRIEHYILYRLGDQRSLIKVDISEQPFMFWYYDLLGRSPTNAVKDTIASFAWEKGGEKERYLREHHYQEDSV